MSTLQTTLKKQSAIDAEIARIDRQADRTTVALIRGDSIRPEPINWLWPGWLASGKMHILGGQPGTGKTTIGLALAATLARGGRWPDGTKAPIGSAVIWSGEDDPTDTLAPRLIAMGADMRRVHFVGGTTENEKARSFDPATDMLALQSALHAIGDAKLLVVDPIVSAVAADSHKNGEVRRGLQPLVDLAQAVGCALVGITHFSKGTQGREPIDRITGSLAFGALARVVLVCAKEQQAEDDQPPRRIFLRAKSNIGVDDGGFVYDIQQGELSAYPGIHASSISWGEKIEGSARDILADAEAPREEGGALTDAQDWLRDFLSDGPQTQREVKAAAEAHCHAWKTVLRSKKALGVESRKMGGDFGGRGAQWHWMLPESHKMAKNTQDAQQKRMATLCKDGHLGSDDAISDAEEIDL